jgi:hypothetical protein
LPIEHATGGTIRRLIGSFFTAELTTSALCATNQTISPFSSRIQVVLSKLLHPSMGQTAFTCSGVISERLFLANCLPLPNGGQKQKE